MSTFMVQDKTINRIVTWLSEEVIKSRQLKKGITPISAYTHAKELAPQ